MILPILVQSCSSEQTDDLNENPTGHKCHKINTGDTQLHAVKTSPKKVERAQCIILKLSGKLLLAQPVKNTDLSSL